MHTIMNIYKHPYMYILVYNLAGLAPSSNCKETQAYNGVIYPSIEVHVGKNTRQEQLTIGVAPLK